MKTRNISLVIGLLTLFISVAFNSVNAQENERIQLIDQNTNEPITEATFQYADQNGISNEEGFIEFQFVPLEKMKLSHVTYGQYILTEEDIRTAMSNQIFHWEESPLMLYPVTILALRPKTNENKIIKLDYQDNMAHDGGSVLTQTPVISTIKKSGSYGFDPVLRGFKYDQLNIVLDGVQSATAACPNRMDPPTSQMAPNMLDRIEILKGPHALRYGSGFGGTINFISTPKRFTEERDLYGRVSAGYETNGHVFREEGVIGVSGARYDVGLFGSWSQGRDYKDGNKQSVDGEFLRGSLGIAAGFKLTDKHQLNGHVNNNLARNADLPAYALDLSKDDTWMVNLGHIANIQKKTLKTWESAVYGSFVKHLMDNELKELDPRMVDASTNAKTRTYGGRTEGLWKWTNMTLYTGVDVRVEEAEGIREREFLMGPMMGKTVFDNAWQHGRINKTGVFAEYHYAKKGWQLVLASRLEVNNANTLETSAEFSNVYNDTKITEFNPSVSIGTVKNFKKGASIGLWLGRAQRSGSLTERYINYFPIGQDPYEMLGNPNIQPEINNQADLTFQYRHAKASINVDVFASYLQDAISSAIDTSLTPRIPSSPGVRSYINIDKGFKTGVEFTWLQEWVKGLQHQMSLAYTYGQDLTRDEPLPEIAPLDMRFRLMGNFVRGKVKPEFGVRHVIQQARISTEYGETQSPSFTILDASFGSQISDVFGIIFGVKNLLGTQYYEHLSRSVVAATHPIFEPGRSYFISLNLNFM